MASPTLLLSKGGLAQSRSKGDLCASPNHDKGENLKSRRHGYNKYTAADVL
jgi:hypothetical protein